MATERRAMNARMIDEATWQFAEEKLSLQWSPHPLKYCLGLAAARAAAVQIFENSATIRIDRGGKPVIKIAAGEVVCRFVVLTGNVYLGEFGKRVAPELVPRIMPVDTYIITT